MIGGKKKEERKRQKRDFPPYTSPPTRETRVRVPKLPYCTRSTILSLQVILTRPFLGLDGPSVS